MTSGGSDGAVDKHYAADESDLDLPVLRYALSSPLSLALVAHHDDDTGRGDTPYETGSERALAGRADLGLTTVSVRDDWPTVFVDR